MEMTRTLDERGGNVRMVVLVAFLVASSAVAIWYWSQPRTQPDVDQGKEVAEAFLSHIREGHPDLAWETTTADFKSDQGKESFSKSVKKREVLKQPLEFVSVQTVTLQERPRSEFLFRSPDQKTVRVLIGSEGGTWKVDRLAQ